ncbi:MAG: hypothetical protein K2J26_02435 [Ruminococcus sp.]|nr:hypothetical protein [Ruminococcus sp.]
MNDTVRLRIEGRELTISWLDIITFLFFTRTSLINFFSFFNVPTFIIAGLIIISMTGFLILYTLKHRRKIKWDGIILIVGAALFFAITLRLHPEYEPRYLDIYNGGRFSAKAVFNVGAAIYAYYIIRLYEQDADRLYRLFNLIPYVLFCGNLVLIFSRNSEYRMDFGYHMAMAGILFIAQYLYQKRRPLLYLSLLCMLLGILYGSRACIVVFCFFVIIYFVWDTELNPRKILLFVMGACAGIIISSSAIMMRIYQATRAIGFDSRTLYLLATGEATSDNARQKHLWPVLIHLLEKSSLLKMYGTFGDRYYLPSYYPYAHNIVLEMLLTFGKLIGGCILVVIALNFLHVIFKQKSEAGLLTIAFGCFSVCRLFVSSSFWMEPYFWAFLAMLVNCKIISKKSLSRLNYYRAMRLLK